MPWLLLILRWLHIVAAITAVGGIIFMRLALVPSVSVLADEQRKVLHEQIRSRWAKIVAASIFFLLVTGIVNFILFNIQTNGDAWAQWRESYNTLYQATFGVKFLLALVIFFLASALAGRTEATKRFRDRAKFWMTVNLALALLVVALSNILRSTHTGPNLPQSPAVTSPSTPSNG
jgi:uncharacterized membrane protein